MAKPNFRWFGSGDNAIVFDVDDVSCVRITSHMDIFLKKRWHDIDIEFYHRDTIRTSLFEDVCAISEQYQQIYDWARNELAPDKVNEMEDSLD